MGWYLVGAGENLMAVCLVIRLNLELISNREDGRVFQLAGQGRILPLPWRSVSMPDKSARSKRQLVAQGNKGRLLGNRGAEQT